MYYLPVNFTCGEIILNHKSCRLNRILSTRPPFQNNLCFFITINAKCLWSQSAHCAQRSGADENFKLKIRKHIITRRLCERAAHIVNFIHIALCLFVILPISFCGQMLGSD